MRIPFAFVRRREPDYTSYTAPVHRETGAVVIDNPEYLNDPVRQSEFDGLGGHPRARRFSTFAAFAGFGQWEAEGMGGRLSQPAPLAWTPTGALAVDAPREVVLRPPARGQ